MYVKNVNGLRDFCILKEAGESTDDLLVALWRQDGSDVGPCSSKCSAWPCDGEGCGPWGWSIKVALDLDWLVKHEDSIAMIWDVPLQFLSLKIFRTNFKAQSSNNFYRETLRRSPMMSDHIQMKSWKLRVTNPSKPPGRGLWFGVSMEMRF